MSTFICPFEAKGIKDGTIIEVTLPEDSDKRITLAKNAFVDFHKKPESPGIRFILPSTILSDVGKNEHLAIPILAYQAELLAVELDHRLFPFLPYQINTISKESARQAFENNSEKLLSAYLFSGIMQSMSPEHSRDIAGLAKFLKLQMYTHMLRGVKSPTLVIQDETCSFPVLTIGTGGIIMHLERKGTDQSKNNNCFSLVKTPFYPPAFGRYSTNVEIVLSRERDFSTLPTSSRDAIRRSSNQVLREHGVSIENLDKDKPEGAGLWNIDLTEWN